MHIAGCFRRSIIVPHLCHRLPPMLFIGRSGNTVDRSLTRWVRSWRPVPVARPFGQGGMLPRYPFIRLSMNPEDYFSPHPLFHTFFGFDSPSVGTFFQGKSSHPIFHTFLWFERKVFEKTSSPCIPHFFQILQPVGGNFFSGKVPLTLYSTLFSRLDEKIIKLFLRKTVGTLLALIIESKNIFHEIFFRTKKKQKKKTGSADSHRRTRETIRGATEKRAFSLLFFFCFSIYSSSCIVHIGGSW